MTKRPLSDRECRERYGLPRWGYDIMRVWFTDDELRLHQPSADVIHLEVERLKRICREEKIGPGYEDRRA